MPCTARPQRTAPPSRRLWETRMHRKPLYSAQPFAEPQCAVCLWSCSEGTDAAKVSRNFHWFQRTPRSQRARGAAGRRSQLSDGVSGSCLSHANERGPSASTDANPDRPARRAGPAVCPGPASLRARELPCSRTEPPACPSRGWGWGRQGRNRFAAFPRRGHPTADAEALCGKSGVPAHLGTRAGLAALYGPTRTGSR